MPSISELFGAPELGEENDTELDIDALLSGANAIIDNHETARLAALPAGEEPGGESTAEPVASGPSGQPEAQSPAGEEEGESGVGGDLPPAAAPVPPNPLLAIPPERQAQLLALDQAMAADPETRSRVIGAVAPPPPAAAPAPEPITVPDGIDPNSLEGMLWTRTEETNRAVAQLAQDNKAQSENFAKQAAIRAANAAGDAFAARYAGKLEPADVLAIAKYAGQTGLAGAMATTAEASGEGAQIGYDRALESVLYSTPAYRDKVIGAAPAAVAPGTRTPEATTRQRKLTAIGGAASPVSGPPAKRPPLENRTDGRLTPSSCMQLVREVATGLAKSSLGEGTL